MKPISSVPRSSHSSPLHRSPAEQASPFKPCGRRRRAMRSSLLAALGLILAQQTVLQAPVVHAQATPPASSEAAAPAPVNINTADAQELADGLQGIGGSKAEAIVRYREQFGDFESVEELSEVTGIGAATVERNRGRITLR